MGLVDVLEDRLGHREETVDFDGADEEEGEGLEEHGISSKVCVKVAVDPLAQDIQDPLLAQCLDERRRVLWDGTLSPRSIKRVKVFFLFFFFSRSKR